MYKFFYLVFFISFLSCQKEEDELSKARTLWGQWKVNETEILFDNDKGMRISTTPSEFTISFSHTNNGVIKKEYNLAFLWAVQDDPDVLIISPDLFSVDTSHQIILNEPDLFYIGTFTSEKITLHNEKYTHIDSLYVTIERNWILSPL